MSERDHLGSALVIPVMPDPNHSGRDEELFRRLSGATIVWIGTPAESPLEGGGLVIDYRLPGEPDISRAVLAFNENGMWLMYDGRCLSEPIGPHLDNSITKDDG